MMDGSFDALDREGGARLGAAFAGSATVYFMLFHRRRLSILTRLTIEDSVSGF